MIYTEVCTHLRYFVSYFTLKYSRANVRDFHAVIFGPIRRHYKENGPRAIWLNRFWCLMINTTCGLMCLLVFMFVVHRMLK
jgi:hypothetical protein